MTASRGILAIDKDEGPTSHDIVAQMRRILGMRKIGHCGTLDPLATGVLVVCFGVYTRLSDAIADTEKEYTATLILGANSDTSDAEGTIEPVVGIAVPNEADINAVAKRFRGVINQIPPAHSAVKLGGVRSYKFARRNQTVDLPARRVSIRELEISSYAYPRLDIRVICSKGTYIRALARDMGKELGCGAYIAGLRRLRVGTLDLSVAVPIDRIREAVANGTLNSHLIATPAALSTMPAFTLDADQVQTFLHGGTIAVPEATIAPVAVKPSYCAVYDSKERLCGLATVVDGEQSTLRPLKVLMTPNRED